MKKIMMSLIILFIGYQCSLPMKKNKELEGCDTVLINQQYFDTLIPVYSIDPLFFEYLDTIIETEKRCTGFDECLTGFQLISYTDSNKSELLNIETISNKYKYDYSQCKGVFIYKNFNFMLTYADLPILKAKDSVFNQKYVKHQNHLLGYDDRWSAWTFELKDKKYILKDHFQCDTSVFNKNY